MAAVELYIYDLTRGLARQFAPALIGRPLDGIWHTAIVVFDTEFYFDGEGICRGRPGQTRFGQPVRIHPLGVTEIEAPLLEAYLAGLADTFGPGKYHLLERNCNNFSNEVSEFLVGHGIPSEIVSMPQDLLNTPIGQLIRPYIDQAYGHQATALTATAHTAPLPAGPLPPPLPPSTTTTSSMAPAATTTTWLGGQVHEVTVPGPVRDAISSGRAIAIDFTSPSCGPCVAIAPVYAQLARACVDVLCLSARTDQAPALAAQYGIRVTPTFLFFHGGRQIGEMKGANRTELENRIFELDRLAKQSKPALAPASVLASGSTATAVAAPPPGHVHTTLAVPLLRSTAASRFAMAQLPLILKKLASFAEEAGVKGWTPAAARTVEERLNAVLERHHGSGESSAPALGPVAPVAGVLEAVINALPTEKRFPALDLWRVLLLDSAAATHYVTVAPKVLPAWLDAAFAPGAAPGATPPAVRLMLLRATCNFFASDLGRRYVGTTVAPSAVQAAVQGLLAEDANLRETAASMAYNLALMLPKTDADVVIELTSAVVHRLATEGATETAHRLLAALGHLLYGNDAAGTLAVTLGAADHLGRLLADAVTPERTRDLILQVQLVLPAAV